MKKVQIYYQININLRSMRSMPNKMTEIDTYKCLQEYFCVEESAYLTVYMSNWLHKIGQGDHFLPHKFIERSFEHWANTTKQLLNAGWGHQTPRKASYGLRKEVGEIIKDKKRDKRVRDEDPSWGESPKRN